MFRKTKHPLDGCCTKDQQIEMYRTLYAEAAKERDEARALVKKLDKLLDEAIKAGKTAVDVAGQIRKENERLTRAGMYFAAISGEKNLLDKNKPTPPTGGSAAQES